MPRPAAGGAVKLVIIESPFACDPEDMTRYARKCVRDSVLRGEAPIASHILFTQPGILDDTIPVERQMGIDAGHAWLPVANLVAVYTDYGLSNGMKLGIERAHKAGKEVEYRQIGILMSPDDDRFDDMMTDAEIDIREDAADDERSRLVRSLHVEATRHEWMGWGSALRWIADRIERGSL